jgi:hypothetical protein
VEKGEGKGVGLAPLWVMLALGYMAPWCVIGESPAH